MPGPGGWRLRLRPLSPGDGDRLRRFGQRLSPESRYRRFLSPIACSPELVARLLDVDHRDREAIVLLEDDEIVAVARYARQAGAESADIAIVVADDWQRRGLGALLLRRLARLARLRGVRSFSGAIAGENRPAQVLVAALAPGVRAWSASGLVEFEIPLSVRAG